MSNRRVVVTGIGLVSTLGIGTEANWTGLLAGTSGVTRVTRFDVTGYAGGLTKFEPREMERLIVPAPAMLDAGVVQ